MTVSDFEDSNEVGTVEELRAVLARRFPVDGSQVNSFWLGRDEFPLMSILVKDDLASVWYTDQQDHPGANSVGSVRGLPRGEGTVFYLNGEREWVPNESIVTVSEACLAAEEFFASGTRPTCIGWLDL